MNQITKKTKYGFTLIEIMVSALLIGLLFSFAFVSVADFKWISNETNYTNALRLLNLNDRLIRAIPFDSLPPDVKRIPSTGIIELSRRHITPESVVIIKPDGQAVSPDDFRVDYENGTVSFQTTPPVGQKVVIKYSYLVPDTFEICRISDSSPYTAKLINNPINKVFQVELIEGEKNTLLDKNSYKTDNKKGEIIFNQGMKGRIVQVKYLGQKIRSMCSSKFVEPGTLEESATPTDMKLIKIREVYGSGSNLIETVQLRSRK